MNSFQLCFDNIVAQYRGLRQQPPRTIPLLMTGMGVLLVETSVKEFSTSCRS